MMTVNKMLNEHLTLISVGIHKMHKNKSVIHVDTYEIKFEFHKKPYSAFIDSDSLNWNLPKVRVERDGMHDKQLQALCEGAEWSYIKSKCKHLDEWMKDQMSMKFN